MSGFTYLTLFLFVFSVANWLPWQWVEGRLSGTIAFIGCSLLVPLSVYLFFSALVLL